VPNISAAASRRSDMMPADAGEIPATIFEGQKNDFRDAEAVQRPTMKFVATKTTDQLDL
jgi:transposase